MPLAAQDVVRKSEKMRPVWLSDKTPRTTNATFHYRVVEAVGKTLDEARHNCLLVLSEDVERTWKVSGQGTQDIRSEQVNGNISEQSVFTYHYDVAGEEVSVTTTRYDEYWECRSYPDGMRYHCYMLFGVADTAQPDFDRLSFTRKYGARGLWRSMIIPGWGQMYKGKHRQGPLHPGRRGAAGHRHHRDRESAQLLCQEDEGAAPASADLQHEGGQLEQRAQCLHRRGRSPLCV